MFYMCCSSAHRSIFLARRTDFKEWPDPCKSWLTHVLLYIHSKSCKKVVNQTIKLRHISLSSPSSPAEIGKSQAAFTLPACFFYLFVVISLVVVWQLPLEVVELKNSFAPDSTQWMMMFFSNSQVNNQFMAKKGTKLSLGEFQKQMGGLDSNPLPTGPSGRRWVKERCG